MSGKHLRFCTLAGAAAAILIAGDLAASSETPKPADGLTRYRHMQGFSYTFGTKFTSGYFVKKSGRCFLTLMIVEKPDPDTQPPATAARFRILLNPGQIAGLDSEEGGSLNFTCDAAAEALKVELGERERLVTRQMDGVSAGRKAGLTRNYRE